jgi:hypothetical protein
MYTYSLYRTSVVYREAIFARIPTSLHSANRYNYNAWLAREADERKLSVLSWSDKASNDTVPYCTGRLTMHKGKQGLTAHEGNKSSMSVLDGRCRGAQYTYGMVPCQAKIMTTVYIYNKMEHLMKYLHAFIERNISSIPVPIISLFHLVCGGCGCGGVSRLS